jgi:subtilisin-like proprotein convertase family protein
LNFESNHMPLIKLKHLAVATVAWLWLAASAPAGPVTFSSSPLNAVVPDGNPVGISSTLNVSGLGNILGSGDNVSLTLNISGGNNGDLTAYLSHDGHIVTLLDLPGVMGGNPEGYTNAGFNVTLSDGTYGNINTYGASSNTTSGGQITGIYNPAGGNTAFQGFNGTSPNGDWVLFIADKSGGDPSPSVLKGWSLTLDAGPEPIAGSNTLQRYPTQGVKVPVATLLSNDSAGFIAGVSPNSANRGTVTLSHGWVFYAPAAGFTNVDSFTYTLQDALGSTAVGTVTVAIIVDNNPGQSLTITDLGNGSFLINGAGIPGRTYRLQYAVSLSPASWTDLPNGSLTTDGMGSFQFTNAPVSGSRYYRSIYP